MVVNCSEKNGLKMFMFYSTVMDSSRVVPQRLLGLTIPHRACDFRTKCYWLHIDAKFIASSEVLWSQRTRI